MIGLSCQSRQSFAIYLWLHVEIGSKPVNLDSKISSSVSRRKFLKTCTAGAAAVASGAIWSFDPTRADAAPLNGPATLSYSLDQNWLFGSNKVTLPHCVANLSWHKWDAASWQKLWNYHREISISSECANRRVFVKFDGVLVTTKPTFNGQALTPHVGGYLPFTYELTSLLKPNGNVLDVSVDSTFQNVPPDGNPKGTHSVDYYEPGGIFRSVSLQAVPQVFISDVFAKPVEVLKPTRLVEVLCTVDAGTVGSGSFELKVELMDGLRVVANTSKKLSIKKSGKIEVPLTLSNLLDIKLWDVDDPQLYTVVTTLLMDGKPLHDYRSRIGFREANFTVDGFFLNGKKLVLFGLDRHEIYPYVGLAMPPRVMRHDAEIIRRDFNCNIVRCSHYPQNEAFLDACDELGLMVWQETPGWGYLGSDPVFQGLVQENVRDMVLRDRNHASIIIWGVRVNESRNDAALYSRTKAIAKELDGSRPTAGSMTNFNNWQEEYKQDVFARDDYHSADDGSVGIYEPLPGIPYMLAETVGQYSYGGKGFSNQYYRSAEAEMQSKQAIYHAQAHDRVASFPRFCGAIAWCAFEYPSPQNSHEGIKNPGVSDVFRIPKLGASFYLAQADPKVRPVIAPNFYWGFDGKSPKGPGKNAAIFSNCERLEVFVAGKHHATAHADRKNYPHLRYAPFFVNLDVDGAGNPELQIDGYIGDAKVISKSLSSDKSQDQFLVELADKQLVGDGADATRLAFRVADKYGNDRLLGSGAVKFTLTGPGVIVGDNPFDLADSGGVGAVWVKTLPNSTGEVSITASHASLGAKSVSICVEPDTQSRIA